MDIHFKPKALCCGSKIQSKPNIATYVQKYCYTIVLFIQRTHSKSKLQWMPKLQIEPNLICPKFFPKHKYKLTVLFTLNNHLSCTMTISFPIWGMLAKTAQISFSLILWIFVLKIRAGPFSSFFIKWRTFTLSLKRRTLWFPSEIPKLPASLLALHFWPLLNKG